jgi:ubiquinone/menaquinone biosynthesis C-methylase UbiE
MSNQTNDEQSTLWNGPAGHAWVDAQALLDQILQPFELLLVEAVRAASARRVLDVGCGTGGTTLAVARARGPECRCTGVDISEPMIAHAQRRAEHDGIPASFLCADAEAHVFEPASFDMIISRFGVMFFEDPVRAFSNLRRAAQSDVTLRFVAWRSAEENSFMTTAERAAAPYLPNIPPRVPDAPGQCAFADASRVRRILEQSGWSEIDIQPFDAVCTFPEKELVGYLTRLGPLGRALVGADEETKNRVLEKVRGAFDPYVHGTEVRFDAACWSVGAV